MITASSFIQRQTAINVAVCLFASLLPFLLVFEIGVRVPVWGVGNYVFDFLPQGFMIAFMSILMPGMSAAKALREGSVSPVAHRSQPTASLVVRAGLFGSIGAAVGVGLAAGMSSLTGASVIEWTMALSAKLIYGGLLSAIVTPIGLRAALARQ